jgi:hypothetical protein
MYFVDNLYMLLYQPWNLLDLGESFGEGTMESSLAMPFIEALSITKAFFNEYRSSGGGSIKYLGGPN